MICVQVQIRRDIKTDMYFHMIFLIYLVNNIKPTDLWALFLYRLEDSPTLCLRFGESGAHEGALSEQYQRDFCKSLFLSWFILSDLHIIF